MDNTNAYVPGTTTSGCQGVRKAAANSVAFLTCLRHGVPVEHTFVSPQTWAGSDPRAQPGAAILAAGQRITMAAARISRHLDHHQLGSTNGLSATVHAEATTPTALAVAPASPPERDPTIGRVLLAAEQFYTGQLAGSWVPAYLRQRGITGAAMEEWHIGYAPGGWTALTSYLRGRGHPDDAIQAAGLARISSRGTVIDHFRDRVMLPVRDESGALAGFIGRARPGAGPAIPKYLNGPATSAYQKGDLLFGLHHAGGHLARGATPVIAEGPFDAIAVTLADPRPLRRTCALRHRPDQPPGLSTQPHRRPPPHRNPRRLRRRPGGPQGRRPRLRHPPRHQRPPAISHALRTRTPLKSWKPKAPRP